MSGKVLAQRYEEMARGQSERLVPMIQEVMVEARVAFDQLSAIGVTRGPGAFTGVRIGLSTARGLGLALGIPVIGVTCFEVYVAALAGDQRAGHPVLVLLEAKRKDVFVQGFDGDGHPLFEPASVLPDDLAAFLHRFLPERPRVWLGDAAARVAEICPDAVAEARVLPPADVRADAAVIASLAAQRSFEGVPTARPLYLRPPDVTLSHA